MAMTLSARHPAAAIHTTAHYGVLVAVSIGSLLIVIGVVIVAVWQLSVGVFHWRDLGGA